MKKWWNPISILWKAQFKVVDNDLPPGYQCSHCDGQHDPNWCARFYCPFMDETGHRTDKHHMLKYRFYSVIYRWCIDKLEKAIYFIKH